MRGIPFDSFVVGATNQYAHAACSGGRQSARQNVQSAVHSRRESVSGKTHLMQAIGHHIAGRKKGARVLYITSERFTE
jgi:chromosomal replication initiator protein